MIFASRLRILTAHCLREYRKLGESRVRVLSIRYIPTASTRPKHWCYIQTVTVQAAFRDAPADSIRVRVLRFGHTCAHSLYPHLQLWIFVLIPAHAHLLCLCHTVCSFLPLFQASTSHRRFPFFPFFVLPSIYPLARVWLIGLAWGSFQTSQQPSLFPFSFSPYCYYTLCVLYSIIPSFHSYCFFFLLSTLFSLFLSFFLSRFLPRWLLWKHQSKWKFWIARAKWLRKWKNFRCEKCSLYSTDNKRDRRLSYCFEHRIHRIKWKLLRKKIRAT